MDMETPNPNPKSLEEALERQGASPKTVKDDVADDGGGQKTEVAAPYNGEGGVRRGYEKREHSDLPEDDES